jgi:hypothetical protein
MAKLLKNVVTKEFLFSCTFSDGRTEDVRIRAESADAAALLLPDGVANWEIKTIRKK